MFTKLSTLFLAKTNIIYTISGTAYLGVQTRGNQCVVDCSEDGCDKIPRKPWRFTRYHWLFGR